MVVFIQVMAASIVSKSLALVADYMTGKNYLGPVLGSLGEARSQVGGE